MCSETHVRAITKSLGLKPTGGDTPVDVIGKEGQPHGYVVLLFAWWTHA